MATLQRFGGKQDYGSAMLDAKMELLEIDTYWNTSDAAAGGVSDDEDLVDDVVELVEDDVEVEDDSDEKGNSKKESSSRRPRPDLDGMTHEVKGDEFLRSLEYKTTAQLKRFLSNLKDWIMTSNRLNQSDFEQYKMVKNCLDGRCVSEFPSTRKLFKMWKERHSDKPVKEYDGLPLFCYNFHPYEMQEISERKREGLKKYLQGVALRIQAQKKRKQEHGHIKKEDPFDDIGDDDWMWVSFYPEMIQSVAQDLGRELRSDEKQVIEDALAAISSYLSGDGKYYVEMIVDDREVVSQRQVTSVLRKYHAEIVKQFGKANFSTLLGQIPEDDNSLFMRQQLKNLYVNEVQKVLTTTFSSAIRQMFELDGSLRRKKCLAQTLAAVEHLDHLLHVLKSEYVFDDPAYESLTQFENTLSISFSPTFWRNCLCKLMKFPMPRVRNFRRANKSATQSFGTAGPTFGSTGGGTKAYLENVSKIYSQKVDFLDMQSQHRDLLQNSGVTTVGGCPVPPLYKPEQQQKSGGQKKIECQGCGRKIEVRGCMLRSHNCTPSKEWKLAKAQRAMAKQRENERKRIFKKNRSKSEKSDDGMPAWQRRHFQGYRCLTGKVEECQCRAPAHWKHFGKACQDNAVANKLVIEEASKNGYLPVSVMNEPGMVEWLVSGRDEIRLSKCPDKHTRYQFFKAYIEDLTADDCEDERYRPVVVAVFKINGVEGLELVMDPEDYMSESHRWKNGKLQLIFNPDAKEPEILPGMELDLNALFVKNRIDPSFNDGAKMISWLFNSFSGWKYHREQLAKPKEGIDVAVTEAKAKTKQFNGDGKSKSKPKGKKESKAKQ